MGKEVKFITLIIVAHREHVDARYAIWDMGCMLSKSTLFSRTA
jgi:hypothetical protein